MRYAAGQLPDNLHFLRLPKLGFKLLAGGHIADDALRGDPVLIRHIRNGCLDIYLPPVFGQCSKVVI